MFKSLACFALLIFAAPISNSFASSRDSMQLAAVASGKLIHGKGIHNQCLPFALGLAQVFHDQYKVASVGIVYTWVVPGFPVIVGRHIVDRVLQLPLTSISDREYIGGALMAGTMSH